MTETPDPIKIPKVLPNLLKTLGADYKHEMLGERLSTTPKHYSYLKISEGCNRPCSFCAIPIMRGKHRSKSIETLVNEVIVLAQKGIKELKLKLWDIIQEEKEKIDVDGELIPTAADNGDYKMVTSTTLNEELGLSHDTL